MDVIIERVLQANPNRRRLDEECERLDAADTITLLPPLQRRVRYTGVRGARAVRGSRGRVRRGRRAARGLIYGILRAQPSSFHAKRLLKTRELHTDMLTMTKITRKKEYGALYEEFRWWRRTVQKARLNAALLLMIKLPCYVRVLKTNYDAQTHEKCVDEDEILYVNSEDDSEWYGGSRLSGEQVIAVSKEVDENWLEGTVIGGNGKRLGKAGYFPKPFIVALSHLKDNRAKVSLGANATTTLGSNNFASKGELYDVPPENSPAAECAPFEKVVFRNKESTSQKSATDRVYARSMYPFRSEESSEQLDPTCCERLEKQLHGKTSVLPSSFTTSSTSTTMQPRSLSVSPKNALGMASVLFDFTARQNDELSVCAGDSVSLVKMVNDEWAFCFDPANNRSGILPLSFLHVFGNDDDEDDLYEGGDNERTTPLPPAEFESLPVGSPTAQQITIDADQLDAFFGFSSGDSMQPSADINSIIKESFGYEQEKKKLAPARPPPPKLNAVRLRPTEPRRMAPPRPVSLPSFATDLQTPFSRAGPNLDMEATKQRVVEELIASELQYLSDIGMWQVEIENSSSLSAEHKVLFTNGIPQLKELSKKLIEQLAQQQGNPCEKQCYGFAFMQMRDDFMRTFALHFRCIEAINTLIETEPKVQSALRECVAEMRALGSNVFDVHTVVTRPIQRCLKYPLFIAELIKNTPISHIDHPKLVEALKQMSVVASKMNESKRRKELAQKYKAAEQESFSKRLSKLNIHTVKKKSNRFKYRLTSQIGLVRMHRDAAFDSIAHSLEISERRVCKFLHALQGYKHLISSQTRRYVDTFTANDKLSANTDKMNAEIRGFCKNLLLEVTNLNTYLDSTAVQEAKKYLRLPVTRMIQKRYDKLIDFESAKRSDKNVDDLRIKQGDYEALNNQLKMTLPKIIENINKRTFALVDSVILKDEQFFMTIAQLRDQLSSEACAFFVMPYRHFVDPYESRLRSLIAVGRMASEAQTKQLPENSFRQSSITDSPTRNVQKRMQTELERDALIRIMRGQGTESLLMLVVQRWPPDVVPDGDDQLCVERGDVLMVLTKGTLQQPWYDSSNAINQPSSQAEAANKVTKTEETDLIDLEENLLDLNSPIKAPASIIPVVAASPPPVVSKKAPPAIISPTNPFLGDVLHDVRSSEKDKIEGMRLDSSDAIFGDLFQDAHASRLSLVEDRANSPLSRPPLIPSRPTEKEADLANEQRIIVRESQGESGSQHTYYEPVSSPSFVELCVVQKNDDEGNSAWWLVENEAGLIGYVPANYLSPLS
ncbi:unnamed protein product [Toxocara canis]|uniref:SH3 domain-containing GRB2-like protein n=1 Tax=Toxocara canis TaxID=6265 RepID=A0A183UTH1_TOXCA|nr:unnamed protein product [Toxocara canis]